MTSRESVTVRLDCTRPATHLVRVTQTFPATNDATREFRMAAWVPGSYKIRDFGRHVQDLTTATGRVKQTGKDAWTVSGCRGKQVELTYDVYCRDLTVDTSHVTADHAHVFPATVVLYDNDSRMRPYAVDVKLPRGWSLWSGLETAEGSGKLATASNYDHLIDCPIEAGPARDYDVQTFTVRKRRHRIVTWRPPADFDAVRVTRDVRAIVEATARLWGGLPYDHYTFISHVAADHGGGLEHRNSTVLGVAPEHLVNDKLLKTRFYPLVAHEFFHTWNVKRILPAAFQPYDLQREVYTDLLWLFEGFTTYYELPLLARAGVVAEEDVGTIAAEMLKFYEMAIGRHRRSVSEASRLTWSLLYQPHEHNVNRNVSYYTKGLFVGLCLDWHLRTNGVSDGLDTVMRYLWKHHAEAGVAEDGFAAIVAAATGVDVAAKLRSWTEGTSELPIDKAFRDLGFKVTREFADPERKLGLGVHFKEGDRALIERIPETSPAAGVLQPADEVVAVNSYQWNAKRFAQVVAHKEAGDSVPVAFFREGRLREADVPLTELTKDKISVKVRKGDAAATRRRRAWLGL